MAFVIGIGGSSQSGKSLLANELKHLLKEKRVLAIELDNYTLPIDHIPKIKDFPDWEVPESIDFERLIETLKSNATTNDIVIIEGIHAFANPDLNKKYDLKIYLKISKTTFLERRRKEKRWGIEPDWYLEHVWDSHIASADYPEVDLVISGDEKAEDISRLVLEALAPIK